MKVKFWVNYVFQRQEKKEGLCGEVHRDFLRLCFLNTKEGEKRSEKIFPLGLQKPKAGSVDDQGCVSFHSFKFLLFFLL